MYSTDQLRDLAVRAATIDERLTDRYEPVANLKTDTEASGRRLATWCQSASGGDWVLFAKRLRRDDLTLEAVMQRLGAMRLRANAPLPAWAEDAAWIVPAMLSPYETGDGQPAGPAENAKPFEGLFVGLIAEAERRRDEMLPSAVLECVENSVCIAFADELLADATGLCAITIYENFAICRDAWHKESNGENDPSATGYYDRFLFEMRQSGLRRLFETKPVLLRLLASVVRQWIDTTAEFLSRLSVDIADVRRRLLGRNTESRVRSVSTGLSDPHNFGRSVYIVGFADGGAVVYKPKDLSVDVSWGSLIDWLNERKPPVDMRAARVMPRDGYGWCEFIEYSNCADRQAAERFFQRAGALLCLSYLVAGSDLHEENLIAAGEHPIAIDLEMMFQAADPDAATGAPAMLALEAAQKRLTDSLLSTGLLPAYVFSPDTDVMAMGGLQDGAGGKPQETAWTHINSDLMTPARAPFQPNDHRNLPALDGEKIKLTDYASQINQACAAYFAFIASLKAELLAEDGPIVAFAKNPIRRVLKPTRFYFLLLERLRNHRDMRDGVAWSAHLDFVARLANWDKENEGVWPLFAAERRALADLNIPFFIHSADSDRVRDGAGTSATSGLETGLSIAQGRIGSLTDSEIDWQVNVLRLAAIDHSPRAIAAHHHDKPRRMPPVETMALDRDLAVRWADRIAEGIRSRAIRVGDSAAWIGLSPMNEGGGWTLTALGPELYAGVTGIAIFLAAHVRMTGNTASAELAYAALSSVRHTIRSSGAMRFARILGIGGAAGMGSIIYSLTGIAGLLDDKRLRDDARHAIGLLTDDLIAGDKIYDVIGGSAGCILGLLKFHRETGDEYALNRAVACGNHLLRNRPKDDTLWKHLTAVSLTGMSHGAAGFGYAFAALAKASGNEGFAAAARNCCAYESALFSPERKNWPDLRETDTPYWPIQWCHGAGGIGLARIGQARFGNLDVDVADDVLAAVRSVQHSWPSPVDTACCGNLGNIELLAEAGRILGQDTLTAQAHGRMRGILDAAKTSGVFGWMAGNDDENLGFFNGLSGIGYTTLRCIAPDVLPNILIWE